MRWDGSAWVQVGTPGVSTGYAGTTNMLVKPDGTLMVVFKGEGSACARRFLWQTCMRMHLRWVHS